MATTGVVATGGVEIMKCDEGLVSVIDEPELTFPGFEPSIFVISGSVEVTVTGLSPNVQYLKVNSSGNTTFSLATLHQPLVHGKFVTSGKSAIYLHDTNFTNLKCKAFGSSKVKGGEAIQIIKARASGTSTISTGVSDALTIINKKTSGISKVTISVKIPNAVDLC